MIIIIIIIIIITIVNITIIIAIIIMIIIIIILIFGSNPRVFIFQGQLNGGKANWGNEKAHPDIRSIKTTRFKHIQISTPF